jgi:hypothetical protein
MIGQIVADIPRGLSLTQPQEIHPLQNNSCALYMFQYSVSVQAYIHIQTLIQRITHARKLSVASILYHHYAAEVKAYISDSKH